MTQIFRFSVGVGPLLVSIPHSGGEIPKEIAATMTKEGLAQPDTDFFVDKLYDFLGHLKVPTLVATQSRYVIDLNRPPDDSSLYPERFTTGLVPTTTFAGGDIYKKGKTPKAAAIEKRLQTYWQPYHDKLLEELEKIKAAYGYALLWDAHSIRSVVPALFDDQLPHLNFGSNSGHSHRLDFEPAFEGIMDGAHEYSYVLDGRFKGGYITRTYGQPWEGVHALQLELSQETYMDEELNTYDQEKAVKTAALLERLILSFMDMHPY